MHNFSELYCAVCQRRESFNLLDVFPEMRPESRGGPVRYRPSDTEFRGLVQCSHCRSVYLMKFTFEVGSIYGVSLEGRRLAFLKGRPFAYDPVNPQAEPRLPAFMKIRDGHIFLEGGLDLAFAAKNFILWPEDVRPSCPEYVPENIRELFIEAQKVLRDAGSPRYAAVACRNVIEAVLRDRLGIEETRESLAVLIEKVVKEEKIPPVLADWAHTIRILGNQGAHPDAPPSEEEVVEVLEFTRLFLELIYTLPELDDLTFS